MKVKLYSNTKHQEGLAVQFPYNPLHVDKIKEVLGFNWDNDRKLWHSQGPEVLCEFERQGIEIDWISAEARTIATEFREQLWGVMDARSKPFENEEFGYQRQGTEILKAMPNSILADDMGTGKSKQVLDACWDLKCQDILILAPKTLCYNWANEIHKWHPEWTSGVVPDHKENINRRSGTYAQGRTDFWQHPPNVVIANYEKLRLTDWPYRMRWDAVILDEATEVKNSATEKYKNVKRILKQADRSWALTGTPLEIKLMELYNILGLMRPAILGNYVRFRDQHLETDWTGTVVGAKNLNLLHERIAPFMLRRTKAEVLPQLPPKIYNPYFVKMTAEETKAYQAFTAQFNNWLDEHAVSGRGNPMVEMLRMRQFCCTPWLFTQELGKGSKFEAVTQRIEAWDGQVVVFCFFEEVISLLQQWWGTHPEALISGNVPDAQERYRRTINFNEGKYGKVFLSTDAGGRGLNITGANLIIHYDQLFNPQRMHQREDRLHRIGQENHVTVDTVMCLDTVDYGMYELGQERDQLFRSIVDGAEEMILQKLDAPRLRKLVEGRIYNAQGFTSH